MMTKTALFICIGVLGSLVVATQSFGGRVLARIPDPGAPAKVKVSIEGEVKRVGPVEYRPGMTLLQALHAAGGLTPFASKKNIFLTRGKDRIKLDFNKAEDRSYRINPDDKIMVDPMGKHFWR